MVRDKVYREHKTGKAHSDSFKISQDSLKTSSVDDNTGQFRLNYLLIQKSVITKKQVQKKTPRKILGYSRCVLNPSFPFWNKTSFFLACLLVWTTRKRIF